SASASLLVGREARWFRIPGGERVDMIRRGAVRRIFLRLAEERRARPDRALSIADVVAAGWPGERIRHDAAQNRAKVAIATLRKLGLAKILMTRDDGYLLDA